MVTTLKSPLKVFSKYISSVYSRITFMFDSIKNTKEIRKMLIKYDFFVWMTMIEDEGKSNVIRIN